MTKNRRRNSIWFNPPFSEHIETDIPKEFFRIIEENFPPNHLLGSTINKNTVEVSYSTTQNIAMAIISSNNLKLDKEIKINDSKHSEIKKGKPKSECNRTKKVKERNECPLGGKCVVSENVYECKVIENNKTSKYIGLRGAFLSSE